MFSRKIKIITRLSVGSILFLNAFFIKEIVLANTEDNLIRIIDSNYYRKITYKNQHLILNKMQNDIYYMSINSSQFYSTNNITEYNFEVESKTKFHKIKYINKQALYFANKKAVHHAYLDTTVCNNDLNSLGIKFNSGDYYSIVESLKLTKLFDSTCSLDQKNEITKLIKPMFLGEGDSLTKCFNNPQVAKLLGDKQLNKYMTIIYGNYFKLIESVTPDYSPIEISCDLKTNSLALLDQNTNPKKVSLNMTLANDTNGKLDKEKLKNTLAHEFFHHFQPVIEENDPTKASCINEEFTKAFTELCKNADVKLDKEKNLLSNNIILNFPTDEKIKNNCKASYSKEMKSESSEVLRQNSLGGAKGTGALAKEQSQLAQTNTQQAAAVQTKLQQTVKASDFTQISNETFNTLASAVAPNTQEGKSYTVSSNSDFGRTVQSTMNSFANSGNKLASKLNTALATANTPALASTVNTRSIASTNTATTSEKVSLTTTQSLSKSASAIQQFAANQEAENRTATPTTATTTTTTTNSTPTKTVSDNQGVSAVAAVNTSRSLAASNNASLVTNDSPSTSGSVSPTTTKNSRMPAAITTKTAPTLKNQDNNTLINTIQSLKAFNTVSGATYEQVKKQYSNPNFKNLLQTYDIRIVTKNSSGQFITLGTSGKAKKVFTDNGKTLVKVDEQR